MKKLFLFIATSLVATTMWAANDVTLLNSNFTQWKSGATPPTNSGLSNSNTYTMTDGTNDVASVVGKGCKLNDESNLPTSTGITGYNTNKFRFGSKGNYLYITPADEFFKGGKVRILVSSEQTDDTKELGTVEIGSTSLGTLHAWSAKATCDWQEFDIPASITGTTAQIKITRTSNTMFVWGIIVLTNTSCQTPTNDATFTAGSTSLYITNEVANPSTSLTFTKGDNQSNPTYVVTKGGSATSDASVNAAGDTFTATAAGTYVVTATQEGDGTYCEVSKQVTITVTAQIPVTACSIEGDDESFIGDEVTYTATAANATTFAWYVDDAVQAGETSETFVYTAVKGEHTIYATATNAYTATPIKSNEIDLTVTKIYGEIIKAVHSGAKTATVTGIIGGTVDKNTQDGGKLGSADHYFGIHLAEGNFMPFDTIIITATNVSAFVEIFSTKTFSSAEDSVNYIDHGTFDANKVYKYVLTSSYEWIYLYRTKTSATNMNPTLGSIAVHRPLNYDVIFDAGEGTGSMSTLEYPATVQVTLPACSFTAPEDKTFDAWTTSDATITDGKFAMPAKDVTITATWKDAGGETALDNTIEETKAVKVLENGQLIIEKNGVRYNAQGQLIR